MSSSGTIRSAAVISGLALAAGLALTLAVPSTMVPGFGLLVVGLAAGSVAVLAAGSRRPPLEERDDDPRELATRWSRGGAWAAGAMMICGLLLALAFPSLKTAGLTMVPAGLVAGAVLVAPAVISSLRRILWPTVGIGLVVLGILVLLRLGVGSLVAGYVWELALLFGVAAGGLLLMADGLATGQRGGSSRRSGWSLLTRSGRGEVVRRSTALLRSVVGGLMVLWATGFGIALAASRVEGSPVLVILAALAVVATAVVVIGTPLLVTAFVSRQRLVAERTREAERQRIAAHLHDSVLQTLALVQRQAADPDAVARLAHRQELSLRNWMAGESELGSGSLAAALRAIVIEIEDDTEASIELSMVGDRPTEPRDEALLAATREALRNSARHARGSPVAVYAEVMDRLVEIYVRDDGPGFAPDEIPDTRRGIRDAIVARMQAVGGSAEVIAEPGHGTEVLLRLPAA